MRIRELRNQVGLSRAKFGALFGIPLRAIQGCGYGKEALKQIIAYFKDNGATNIRLSTKESNVKAIHLYESAGKLRQTDLRGPEHASWQAPARRLFLL